MSDGPLSDLRVIELGNIVAGPFASSILADMGADVIKVERPGTGDIIRGSGETGEAMFGALNRNKRSVVLDLKDDDERADLIGLLRDADVFIENLGRGTPDRIGIGYETLSEVNPELVYLSIKGFQPGPYGDRAGMDVVAEAMSGLMGVTGEPGRQPVRVGTSIADMGAALYGVIGVLLALRERSTTGEGQRVDATLYESASHWMGYWLSYADRTGRDPEKLGASHPSWGLYDIFETDPEEWVFVGVTSERHWPALCRVLEAEDLLADERFDTATKRRERKTELRRTVAESIADWDREKLIAALEAERVPVAPVNQPSDLIDDEGLLAADLLTEYTSPADGESAQTVLAPVIGERFEPTQRLDPPALGEHTDAVLDEVVDDAADADD
ncbi:CaiB/BaiF CoA transferase family protein [Halobaculum litoreum]|uniref:CaiB/BaiF CoA transferase family protein n=1 Tax=Halobaculum litoreum TaxID=3031998 RepID=A0ABD5XUY4_9EURY|nr:CaiB/BaiF CoA-transferase family protein [Halobaculum sp. DT92]